MGINSEYFFTIEGCYILEYQNSEVLPGYSIARARLKPGHSTALHLLKRSEEKYIILQGEAIAEIDNNPTKLLSEGDFISIPPGTSQRITNTGMKDLIFLCICFPRFTEDQYVQIEYSTP
jgi:mannose-6-phosphate isomerase-like protein (cupin superfamily)